MSQAPRALRNLEPAGNPWQVSALRRAYFAHAGEIAIRYGVLFDRLLEHLEDARVRHPRLTFSSIRHIDDVVHAVGCVDGVEPAWWDLIEQHERALVRACRQWLEADDAIVFVRRLLSELRRQNDTGVSSLRGFVGICSLRRWLGDRVMGGLNRSGAAFGTARRSGSGWQPVILWNNRGPRARPEDRQRLEDAEWWRDPPAAPGPLRAWDHSSGVSG